MNSIPLQVLLDSQKFNRKPGTEELPALSKNLTQSKSKVTLFELKNAVSQGQTFCPATFTGNRRRNAEFEQQQIFCLDFDSGYTPEQFIERLEELGLTCNLIYSTFSDTPEHRKFRTLFSIPEPITDKNVRDQLQINLWRLFPEADEACKDAARIFFGGKEVIYYDDSSYLNTCVVVDFGILEAAKVKNSKSSLSYFFDKECEKTGRSLYNIKELPQKFPLVDKFDWGKARSKIKILDDFFSGKTKLLHPQLFGLATNFIHIKGGAKLFQETIEKNSLYNRDKLLIIPYLRKRVKEDHYQPMKLKNYSPYPEDRVYRSIPEMRLVKGKVVRVEDPIPTIPLTEAEEMYDKEFQKALEADDNNIYIFKVPTGFGKTERLTKLSNVTIAFPNHDLKSEVGGRMKVSCYITPDLPENLSPPISGDINYYYQTGIHQEVIPYIRETIENQNTSISDKQILEGYWESTSSAYQSEDTVLTTHAKAAYVPFKHNTLVFDEDPLPYILRIQSVTNKDLENLAFQLKNSGNQADSNLIYEIKDSLASERKNVPHKVKKNGYFQDYQMIVDTVRDNQNLFDSDIMGLLEADYFITDIEDVTKHYYLKKVDMPEDKKIIILSATASESIYKRLYGDRVKFFDLTHIEHVGKIVQYPQKGYSRSRLRNSELSKEIIEKTKGEKVITFAEFTSLFENAATAIYFGKCSGFDGLKGQDITIVGTPHVSPLVYALYSAALGFEFGPTDYADMSYREVIHNGYRFYFMTYSNEYLREIQFYFIESNLIQAVGRNRTLREDCTAKVYSSYPLPNARMAA